MSESTQVATVSQADLELMKQFGLETNMPSVEKINSVSIKGSKWSYTINGESKVVEIEVEGEKMAAPSVKSIILNQIPNRSHALFSAYVEGENSSPLCWSTEGKVPDSDVTSPKHTNCDTCPMRAVGSAFTNDNKPTKACKDIKRIAVLINDDATHTPLLMKLPITSIWEHPDTATAKEAQGWFAYDSYIKHLSRKGLPHTVFAQTLMKFDADAAVPKVLFKFNGRIPTEVVSKIMPMVNSDEVKKVLGLIKRPSATPAELPAPEAVAAIEAPKVEAPAPVVEKVVETPKPAPKKAEKKAVEPVAEASADFDDMLSGW